MEEPTEAEAGAALQAVLAANRGALVAAMGSEGRRVPLPDSVQLRGQPTFEGTSGLDLVVADDQIVVIDGWARANTERIVRIDVRLLADPDHASRLSFFDVRDEHGVHVLVFEAHDPELVFKSIATRAALPPGVGHIKRDSAAVFLDVDEATCALLGWTATDMIGHRSVEFVHPEDVERSIDNWIAMRAGSGSGRNRVRYRHADGHHVWLEVTNDNRLDDPDYECVLSELVDISDEMAQLQELRDRERQLARLAEALPIGICHLRPDRVVVYSNEPLVSLLGPVDSIESLIRSVAGGDRDRVEIGIENALRGRMGDLEVGVIHGFEERRCELTFRTMTSDSGSVDGVIVCAADVTDRSRLRSELEHRASHDALSGCLNRAATVTALERALRESQHVAVAYVDLDHFKAVNDRLGHAAGDELLRVAAARLRGVTRVEDRLGRIGGDEFVVICPQGQGPFEAAALVGRLTDAINGDVMFARQRIRLRASVGVAISLEDELDAEAVLSRADAAMYEAKRSVGSRESALPA